MMWVPVVKLILHCKQSLNAIPELPPRTCIYQGTTVASQEAKRKQGNSVCSWQVKVTSLDLWRESQEKFSYKPGTQHAGLSGIGGGSQMLNRERQILSKLRARTVMKEGEISRKCGERWGKGLKIYNNQERRNPDQSGHWGRQEKRRRKPWHSTRKEGSNERRE